MNTRFTNPRMTHRAPFGRLSRLTLALAAASAQTIPAFAQDGEGYEEVVVTGSRIQRSNATSPQPVSFISGEDLRLSGSPDIGESLNKNPALLATITGTNSIDSEPNNVGEADNVGGGALDLRGLGFQRTLTLVNGRRHVSGIEGTSSVDISTIPSALIERVEVLTGGASAIYGADAVTGVVNFILKDDFEGLQVDVRTGVSGEADGESISGYAIWGRNFNDGRGNVVLSFQADYQDGIRQGDRSFLSGDGLWDNDTNPALRFQTGEISADATPNFAQFYDYDTTGRYHVGLSIPTTADDFIAAYQTDFGTTPDLTDAEIALIERAATAPPQAFLPGRTFNITSPYGVVSIGDFGSAEYPLGSEPDLDGNGTPDCLDSFTGYNSSLGGASSFGAAGGCWYLDENGTPQPYVDGLVSDNFNQFGATQSFIAPDRPYVIPKQQKYSLNVNGHYEFHEAAEVFIESKVVYQEIEFGGGGHNFTDLLYGAPDNPFLPDELAAFAVNSGVGFVGPGGLYMSRDSDDWGSNLSTNERWTYRFVAGIRGTFLDTMSYEVSGNYGRFERTLIDEEEMIADRFFAAIDAVTDPATGAPVCRSDLDPTAFPRTTPFNIFPFVGGGNASPFFTFTPGDGQCQPANIWGGRGAISQEAIDFMTYTRNVEDEIEQTVLSALISGDSERFFSLPAGPIGFAFGVEWRDEQSGQTYGEFDRGIIQVSGVTPDGTPYSAGDFVGDVSEAGSLGGTPSVTLLSGEAGYDVFDYFAEVSLPLLADLPFANELTVDAAVRVADYSTFGNNTTWKAGFVYAPNESVKLRGTYSRAIRVPNIFELFSPDQGAFFRPADPCDATQIGLSANPGQRQANCIADLQALGVSDANIFNPDGSYGFEDPLSAGFPGVIGGNANLEPEEADTQTIGVVLTPTFAEGLTLSVDFWEIEIENAIEAISSQNIVDGCYDATSLNNDFCALIRRNDNPTSAQSGGLTFVRQTQLNFGAVETHGIDFAGDYQFEMGDYFVMLNGGATFQGALDLLQPGGVGEPDVVNPELREMRRPEWSAQTSVSIQRGPFTFGWRMQYLDRQVLSYEDGAEIETVLGNFGQSAFTKETYLHYLSGSWEYSDTITIYGGVDNVTDERPYVTERAYPVNPLGRYLFAGVNVTF